MYSSERLIYTTDYGLYSKTEGPSKLSENFLEPWLSVTLKLLWVNEPHGFILVTSTVTNFLVI